MSPILCCPHCGGNQVWEIRRNNRKCRSCRKEWSAKTRYPVCGFRLTEREWKRVLDNFLRDGTGNALVEEMKFASRTAYAVIKCVQVVMGQDVPKTLEGIVEVDATFIGGVWTNKRVHIRRKGTKRGRGTSKQAIFGIVQRKPNRIRVFLVKPESQKSTLPLVKSLVSKGAKIYSDECKAYTNYAKHGFIHDSVNHSRNEYSRGEVHTHRLSMDFGDY